MKQLGRKRFYCKKRHCDIPGGLFELNQPKMFPVTKDFSTINVYGHYEVFFFASISWLSVKGDEITKSQNM